MELKSSVEIKILKFITSYGSERLISWLDSFDKIINSKDYISFRNLERESCKACGISIADMHKFSNTASTNAKRIISFLALHELHMTVGSISKLMSISDRNINYYIGNAEEWINQPKSNKTFFQAYTQVVETLKIQS
jgi:hypothetical protein